MPTLAAVGKSTSRSARDAGRQAASSALDGLGGRAGVILLFATTGYDQEALLAGIREVAGPTPLSGCSAEGVIAQQLSDESSHAVVLTAIASEAATFTPVFAPGLAQDPRACGVAIAEQVRRAPGGEGRCLLLFPDGTSGNVTELLAALENELPYPVLLAGGAAGANISTIRKTYQYHLSQVCTDAVVGVLVGGGVRVETALSHGSMPIGVVRTVTRSEGGHVHEIDGRPAWDVLREYLDGDPNDLSISDSLSLAFAERLPHGVAGPNSDYIMHTPWGLDRATGALFFPGGLRQGAKIQMARRDPDRIREGATDGARGLAQRMAGRSPSLVLQFDCAGRGRVIFGERATARTVASIQDALGPDLPWSGFYTYGEIGPLRGKAFYHDHTVVLCALYDEDTRAS